jgi:hypothetical protein
MSTTRDDLINAWLQPKGLTVQKIAPSTHPLVNAILTTCDELLSTQRRIARIKAQITEAIDGNRPLGSKGAEYDTAFATLDTLSDSLGHMVIAYKAMQAPKN